MKFSNKKKKIKQINYINNRNSLINIEQLNAEIKETFWFGLGAGVLAGMLATLYLMSDKAEKGN